MRHRLLLVLLALACVGGFTPEVFAQRQDHLRRELAGVEVVEQLGAQLPASASFLDDRGRSVKLGDYFGRGRPLLLSLNYTSCPMLCSLQLNGLAKAIGEMQWQPGEHFDILTVSIDPRDTPKELERSKQVAVRRTGEPAKVARGWHFLAGAPEAIALAAQAVGFKYRFDPDTQQYRHQSTLMVLTPDGQVSRYLHGVSYPPGALRAALESAAAGAIATRDEQTSLGGFLLNCFAFDPSDNAPLAIKIMRAGGALTFFGLLTLIGVFGLRDRRRRKDGAEPQGADGATPSTKP
jgi:protein SCO1/2